MLQLLQPFKFLQIGPWKRGPQFLKPLLHLPHFFDEILDSLEPLESISFLDPVLLQ